MNVPESMRGQGLTIGEAEAALAYRNDLSPHQREAVEAEIKEHRQDLEEMASQEVGRLDADINQRTFAIGTGYQAVQEEYAVIAEAVKRGDFEEADIKRRMNAARRELQRLDRQEEAVLSQREYRDRVKANPVGRYDELFRRFPSLPRPLFKSLG